METSDWINVKESISSEMPFRASWSGVGIGSWVFHWKKPMLYRLAGVDDHFSCFHFRIALLTRFLTNYKRKNVPESGSPCLMHELPYLGWELWESFE